VLIFEVLLLLSSRWIKNKYLIHWCALLVQFWVVFNIEENTCMKSFFYFFLFSQGSDDGAAFIFFYFFEFLILFRFCLFLCSFSALTFDLTVCMYKFARCICILSKKFCKLERERAALWRLKCLKKFKIKTSDNEAACISSIYSIYLAAQIRHSIK
jgi:hypothetical protein